MDMAIPGRETPVAARPSAKRRWLLGALFVMLLVAGLLQTIALVADDDGPTPILSMQGRHLVATGMLRHALSQPTLPTDWRGPVIGTAFRNADGADCRRFAGRPAEEGPVAGIACRIEGDWRVVELRQDVATPKLP